MPVIIHISKNTLYAVWITVIVLLIWLQYTGFVLIECPPGYFGKGCRERCSGHCIRDEPCDHINGECSNGCQDGYIWARCSECKKKIYANSLGICSIISFDSWLGYHFVYHICTCQLAQKVITAETAPLFVLPIVKHVETLTDFVHV